jgi:16S rRNA (cytidine1402-2'-O)-methyltransferase
MSTAPHAPGTLYVVATPIGNLDDIGVRAIETLRAVDVIAAEDTRHSGVLLRHLGITTHMVSLHEHNEERRAPALVERLQAGDAVALISDAGTPLVSDPGFRLVNMARSAGIAVSPVPGACALIAALSASGISAARFTFEGFLPATASARRTALAALVGEPRTMIFYESPRRVSALLADMIAVFGTDRPGALCRELTKQYETITSATLGKLGEWLGEDDNHRRGEFVVVVAGNPGDVEDACRPEWVAAVRELREVMPLKQAARIIASATGARSQVLYRLAES